MLKEREREFEAFLSCKFITFLVCFVRARKWGLAWHSPFVELVEHRKNIECEFQLNLLIRLFMNVILTMLEPTKDTISFLTKWSKTDKWTLAKYSITRFVTVWRQSRKNCNWEKYVTFMNRKTKVINVPPKF